jgi:hypothetical protein
MILKLLFAAILIFHLTPIPGQTSNATARKFDEFGDIQASDLIARLDNLAIQLQNEPNTKGFLVVYRTRRDLPGLSNKYAHRMKSYLTDARGVPAARIVIVDGGVAGCLSQELWIVPPGMAPKPRDDAYDNSYRPEAYKFDEHYYQMGNNPGGESYWPAAPENLIGYLEAFGETLQKDRTLFAYLVAFREDVHDKPGTAQTMLRTERNFLIKEFGIQPSRIKTIDGGYRDRRTMELWIAQPGYRPIITSYRVGRVPR